MIRVACCQYQIEKLLDWQKLCYKNRKLVTEAKKENASILLMPEYVGIE